jgi:hypothetical protein
VTKVKQATAAGRDMLVVAGARPEVIAKLVIASAEPLCRCGALETPHASCSTFHAAVVLLKPIIMGWPAPLSRGVRLRG